MSAPNVSESQRLYSAWRAARAEWELEKHSPSNLGSLPDEIEAQHCDKTLAAMMAYFLHPSVDLGEFAQKFLAFHEEDGTGLSRADEIIAAFAEDIGNIAYDATFAAEGRA